MVRGEHALDRGSWGVSLRTSIHQCLLAGKSFAYAIFFFKLQ